MKTFEQFIQDDPDIIEYHENGKIKKEAWLNENKTLFHRHIKPAIIIYDKKGRIIYEGWYIDGNIHRIDNPSEISYYPNGVVKEERWKFKGQYHRTDGPSIVLYDKDGVVKNQFYFIKEFDVSISYEMWVEKLKKYYPEEYKKQRPKKELKDLGI